MIRRPPRSTLDRSSAASDVYKRQGEDHRRLAHVERVAHHRWRNMREVNQHAQSIHLAHDLLAEVREALVPVSYTHLRAHETVLDLVCRLLLETKKQEKKLDA